MAPWATRVLRGVLPREGLERLRAKPEDRTTVCPEDALVRGKFDLARLGPLPGKLHCSPRILCIFVREKGFEVLHAVLVRRELFRLVNHGSDSTTGRHRLTQPIHK